MKIADMLSDQLPYTRIGAAMMVAALLIVILLHECTRLPAPGGSGAAAGYACSTQDNGTVVYTKIEDDIELVAQVSDIIEAMHLDTPSQVYNEVNIDDWLTIAGRDAADAQAIYVAGQSEIYAPSNTLIISREPWPSTCRCRRPRQRSSSNAGCRPLRSAARLEG